ncbi:hypothetical protein C8J57DRAFT_491524 [Mycena rebaudengoi]|nr:hypothetical protein C8J57DRAFT_491524 [Mycena rebaudengoi]
MSLQAYANSVAAFANHSSLHSARYAAPYHNAAQISSPFAAGSSLGADHLEHPQRPPPYIHHRGTQSGAPSTLAPPYSSTSGSDATLAPARYATGISNSGYGASAAYSSRPAGRSWQQDAPASADDVQGLAVHGHASEGIQPLRYSAAAAASLSATSPATSSSSCSSGSGSGVFKSPEGVLFASPTPQLPNSVPMAILLNNGRGDHQQPQDAYGDSASATTHNDRRPMPVAYALMYPDTSRPATDGELDGDAEAIEEGFLSREKKHGCTMCHKRFDRPSTLKKHLLVHTGEKAYQCPICERRFGVQSNLNRHIRRCSLREVHTHSSAGVASVAAVAPVVLAPVVTGKRARTPSPAAPMTGASVPRKRRRRPPLSLALDSTFPPDV